MTDYETVDPRTEVKEAWRVQASENVDSHNLLCAIDEIAVDSTEAAIRNGSPLADWNEYNTEL